MNQRPCSLVLAAHGSLAAANSNQPLFDLADRIARRGQFANVTPAFLNGTPAMTDVLKHLLAGDVVIVPVMTSQGYYLRALPGKFALNPNADQFQIFMAPVIGVHPSIPDLVSRRIEHFQNEYQLPIDDTTIVVIGHGTRRNPNSGQSTLALTNKLIARHGQLKFETAFLDQDPLASDVAQKIKTTHTIVIPFLISRAPHSTVDVPAAFSLPTGPDVQFPMVENRDGWCICDLPVGMYPEMDEICIDLANQQLESGKSIEIKSTTLETSGVVQ